MDTARNLPLETDYPYKPYEDANDICSASTIKIGITRNSYYDLTDDQLITMLEEQPLAIAISSDGWTSYTSGVYSCASDPTVNHAVLLVGYT